MANKFTIFASPGLDAALADRMADTGFRSNRSAAISMMCERYAEICRRSLPTFTEAEWSLIFDTMNGSWQDNARLLSGVVYANVSDGIELNDLDEKWGVKNVDEFLSRLSQMTFAENAAVVDAAERFWRDESSTVAAIVGKRCIKPAT